MLFQVCFFCMCKISFSHIILLNWQVESGNGLLASLWVFLNTLQASTSGSNNELVSVWYPSCFGQLARTLTFSGMPLNALVLKNCYWMSGCKSGQNRFWGIIKKKKSYSCDYDSLCCCSPATERDIKKKPKWTTTQKIVLATSYVYLNTSIRPEYHINESLQGLSLVLESMQRI